MSKINGVKIRDLFDLEKPEFLQTVILGYLECEPDKEASADELMVVANWARAARTNAMLLEMLFDRKAIANVTEGKLEIRSVD